MHKIREFLEAGTLVPVAFGQSPGEVRQALGNPPEVGGTYKQRIWKYGAMQIGFQRDKATRTEAVCFIGLYFRQEDLDLPKVIRAEDWFPSRRLPKEDVVRRLDEQDIHYWSDSRLTFEGQLALVTRSGANIIFDCSDGEEVLDSIQLRCEPRPSLKK